MNDLSPEAVSALEAARREFAPSDVDRARLREGIQKRVALGAAAAESTTGAPSASSSTSSLGRMRGLKLLAGGAFVVAAFVATQVSFRDRSAEPQPQPVVQGLTAPSTVAASPVMTAPLATPEVHAPEGAAPSWSPDRLPDAPPPIEVRPKATVSAVAAHKAPSARVAHDPNAANAANSAIDSLGAEMRMLRDAHAALKRGELARARRALDEHATMHPRGALREERLALSALLLCSEGRRDEARHVADELARQSPRSSHLERLRGSCAADAASPSAPTSSSPTK